MRPAADMSAQGFRQIDQTEVPLVTIASRSNEARATVAVPSGGEGDEGCLSRVDRGGLRGRRWNTRWNRQDDALGRGGVKLVLVRYNYKEKAGKAWHVHVCKGGHVI